MHRWSGIARKITSILAAAGATCSCSSHTPAAEVAQAPVATTNTAGPAASANSAPQPSAVSPAPPPVIPSPVSSASAAPPAGKMCGGFAGFRCPEKQYCVYPSQANCGAGDMSGTCKPMPDLCTMEFAPVCGCDGKTYPNACHAARAGVSVSAQGACKTP